ncbi:MAG: CPBP family intramembrane metalloprotease [Bryobacterales bacterium]|nr:CPBP family intramembrane metalloprotease [Bryobacterales bacterium]
MTTPLQPADKRLIALTLLLAASSAVYVSANYNAAFPQASLSLPLTRGQITDRAEALLRARGLNTAGFRNLTVFDPDEGGRLYLERELTLKRANQLMESQVPIWRWRARWFRPPEKEEMLIWLNPEGRLTGFEHRIKETDPGARLDSPAALALAEAFLHSQTDRPQKLVAQQQEARPNRDDYEFTWEEEGFRAKDATIRRTVVLHGDKVGRYAEFLYVPEQWQRDFAKLRSSNDLYAGIAQGLFVVLILIAAALVIRRLRRHAIRWRPLLWIAGAVAVFYFLNEWNMLPFAIDGMQTSSTYPQMVLLALLGALGSSAGILLYVLGPAAAGSTPQLLTTFNRRGVATRSFFRCILGGLCLAACHLSFLTAFYLIGSRAGVWSPQDIDYSDLLATPIPWVYPVAIAMMAASAEEFWFRMLAIPLVRRFVRYRSIAIIIPAFLWGFLHANYPQEPGYIRGVEVGLIGIAAGWLFLRMGIIATLMWHYTIDAFLIGLSLFRAENWLYRINGAVVALFILAPLLISVAAYRRNGGFLPEIEEEAAPAPDPVAGHVEESLAAPLAPRRPARYLYLAAAIFAALALAAHTTRYGDFLRVRVTRDQAETAARAEARRHGLEPSQWRIASDFAENLQTADAEYLRETVGSSRANEILRTRLMTGVWRVRFVQPLHAEEWIFYVNQKGGAYRFDHVLDEKASGAQLPRDEARKIAEQYLSTVQGIPVQSYTLVDSQQEKHDHRTDYSFVWEDPDFRAGDARLRVSLHLVGNETCEFRPFLKLPEAWLRDFRKTRLTSFLAPALLGACGVPLLVAFLRRLGARNQRFHWRTYFTLTACGVALAVAARLNGYPAWLTGYNTSTPLENYYLQFATGQLTLVLFTGAAMLLALMALDAFLQALSPGRALPRPTLARIAAVAVLFAAVPQVAQWIHQHTPGPRLDPAVWDLSGMDSLFPAVDVLSASYAAALMGVSLAGAFLCGAMTLLSARGFKILLGIVLAILALSRSLEPVQIPFHLFAAALVMGVAALLVLTLATDVVSLGTGIFVALSASQAWALIQQPAPFLLYNGVALLALAGLMVAAVWRTCRASRR